MIKTCISIVLGTTLDCNFRCPWCVRFALNQRFGLNPDYMSVETVEKIIKHYPNAHYVLTGGEPMLNLPVLETVIRHNCDVKVSSNGSILWPDHIPFATRMHFDISMNDFEFPILYKDLIAKGFPNENIRFFVYLDQNIEKVLKTIDVICSEPNGGYEVLPEMWIKESKEYEDFIKKVAPLLAEKQIQYGKDDGFKDYTHPTATFRIKKRFDVNGNPIKSLWLQGCPPEELEEMSKIYCYNENNFMQEGEWRYPQGISAFGIPVEYYTAMMYEEMKRHIASKKFL